MKTLKLNRVRQGLADARAKALVRMVAASERMTDGWLRYHLIDDSALLRAERHGWLRYSILFNDAVITARGHAMIVAALHTPPIPAPGDGAEEER